MKIQVTFGVAALMLSVSISQAQNPGEIWNEVPSSEKSILASQPAPPMEVSQHAGQSQLVSGVPYYYGGGQNINHQPVDGEVGNCAQHVGQSIVESHPAAAATSSSAYSYGCADSGQTYQVGSGYTQAMRSGWHSGRGHARIGGQCSQKKWFAGLYGLVLERDYEDDVFFSAPNGSPTVRGLTSRMAGENPLAGFETRVGRHMDNGWSWMISYFGLFSRVGSGSLAGNPMLNPPHFDSLSYDPGAFATDTVANFMNASQVHSVERESEIHNVEFNLIRRTCCANMTNCDCGRGRSIRFDMISGIRYFKFDEDFRFRSAFNGTYGTDSRDLAYDIRSENNLLGYQMGGFARLQLTRRVCFHLGTKAGVYHNQVHMNQQLYGSNGYAWMTSDPTQDFEHDRSKNDIAFLGEIDLGARIRVNNCWNAVIGYRGMGVAGVALAVDQVPSNFGDYYDAGNVDSNGSLLLHGGYAGLEYNF